MTIATITYADGRTQTVTTKTLNKALTVIRALGQVNLIQGVDISNRGWSGRDGETTLLRLS